MSNAPAINTKVPIIVYSFLYKAIRLFTFSVFFSAIGLYNAKTIAAPIPISDSESMERILENNPLSPRYSLDKNKINTFRFTNCNNVVTTNPTIVNITLRILFFVLLILFIVPFKFAFEQSSLLFQGKFSYVFSLEPLLHNFSINFYHILEIFLTVFYKPVSWRAL